MKTIFDQSARKELADRVKKLTPNSKREWGLMRPDQMLHHCNQSLAFPLGDFPAKSTANFITKTLIKWLALSPLPIPKGKGKTMQEFRADDKYDMEHEKAKFQKLLDRYSDAASKTTWPLHPIFGKLRSDQYANILYKHTDHHFRQFGL